jgi:hypothetical protein
MSQRLEGLQFEASPFKKLGKHHLNKKAEHGGAPLSLQQQGRPN